MWFYFHYVVGLKNIEGFKFKTFLNSCRSLVEMILLDPAELAVKNYWIIFNRGVLLCNC